MVTATPMGDLANCPSCGRLASPSHRAGCKTPPPPDPAPFVYRWKPDHCTKCRVTMTDCKCERSPWAGSLEVRCDWRVRSPRDSEQRMLRARRRRDERRAMAKALHPFAPPDVAGKPHGAVAVTFTRHGMRPLDDDGLAFAYKSLRDQVALWLGCKDSPNDPPVWRYEQVRHVAKERDTRRGRVGHQRYEIFTIVRIVTAPDRLGATFDAA